MHIDAWIEERDRRRRAYEKLCGKGGLLVFRYDRTGEGLSEFLPLIRQIDQAYLRWCETDRWPIEHDEVQG